MEKWEKAAEILKEGGVVIIPSDSSYGIASLTGNTKAIEKLYRIKNREDNKPSLVIVGSLQQAKQLVELTPLAEKLAKQHWPGGLTLILEAINTDLSPLIYGADHSLAVRLPAKQELQDLASQVGPFVLPSANFNGQPAPFSKEAIDPALIKLVDFFLDEPTDGNPVSALVDARGSQPIVLRVGAVNIPV